MDARVTALCCCLVAALLPSGDTRSPKSGPYTVLFDPDDQFPTITVQHDDMISPVWFTSRSVSFLRAVKVEQQVVQHSGDFIISSSLPQNKCFNATYGNLTVHGNPPDPVITITGHLCDAQFTISFQAVAAGEFEHLQLNVTLSSTVYNQLWLTYGCEEDEGFFGFGAQYTYLNMKKRRLPLFLSEQGVGRGQQPISAILEKVSPGAG